MQVCAKFMEVRAKFMQVRAKIKILSDLLENVCTSQFEGAAYESDWF